MSMIEYDEYKQKLLAQKPVLEELKQALNIDAAREEYARLQDESAQEGFWNDMEHSQKVAQQIKRLENKIHAHEKLCADWDDAMALCEMALEEDDESLLDELSDAYEKLEKEIADRRLATLLSGEYDANNAILALHSGAGGTEAQDWTQMLYRMYTRWAERHGFTCEILDYEDGRGRHQIRYHRHRGRKCLRLPQERKRRPPLGARFSLRCQCPPPDVLCRRGGHAGNGRR